MLGAPTPVPSPTARPTDRGLLEPVQVTHCVVRTEPKPGLEITFKHVSELVADRIVFRAAYGLGGIDFEDAGTFEPGSSVHHRLKGAKIDVPRQLYYYSLDDAADCTVVSVHAKDGSLWRNPRVETSPAPFPSYILDGMWTFPSNKQRHGFPTPVPSPQTERPTPAP